MSYFNTPEDMNEEENRLKKKKVSGASGAGAAGAKTMAEGGSTTDGLTSAAMASGNPYAIGGAYALKALSGAEKKKKERMNAEKKQRTQAVDTYLQAIDRMA